MQAPNDLSMPEAPPVYGSKSHDDFRCPRCSGGVVRIRRRALDKLMSVVSPRQRFRCAVFGCGWEGTLRVKR
jgi:hypothetical protein